MIFFNKLKPYLINFWIFIPFFIYINAVNEYILNIPYGDDYQAILDFLIEYKSSHSFSHKFYLLFRQHNEHRIFPSRLVYLWYYNIFGEISFKNLIYIANMQLVVIFLLITSFIRKIGDKFWGVPALVLGICVFDIMGYENATWAMAGMQNYGVIMFFMAAIYFYNKEKKWHLAAAIICQFLCAFASGNGMIAGLCLIIFNALNKDKKKAIIAALCFIVFTALYFYKSVSAQISVAPNAPANTIQNILSFFFHMVGAHFSFTYGVEIGIFILVLFIVLAYILFFKQKEKFSAYTPFIVIVCFVLATMATVSKFRLQQGMINSYAGRYFIYTQLLAGILFIILFYLVKKPMVKWTATVFCVLFLMNNYKDNYAYGEGCFRRLRYRMETCETNHPLKVDFKKTADKACAMKIYCIDENK